MEIFVWVDDPENLGVTWGWFGNFIWLWLAILNGYFDIFLTHTNILMNLANLFSLLCPFKNNVTLNWGNTNLQYVDWHFLWSVMSPLDLWHPQTESTCHLYPFQVPIIFDIVHIQLHFLFDYLPFLSDFYTTLAPTHTSVLWLALVHADEPPGSLTPPDQIHLPSMPFFHHFWHPLYLTSFPIHFLFNFELFWTSADPCCTLTCTSVLWLALVRALTQSTSDYAWRCWVSLLLYFTTYTCSHSLSYATYTQSSQYTYGRWHVIVSQTEWNSLGMSHTVEFHFGLPISISHLAFLNNNLVPLRS